MGCFDVKKIAVLLIVASLSLPAVAAEPRFFDSVDDLPLMPGLSEVPGAGMVFDKPDGRIVEAYATTTEVAPREVMRFYADTLPQLGWRQVSDLTYEREGERLELSLREEHGRLTLRLHISPE